MAKKNIGIIQAPDGFYIGSILKTGMMSADSRKISEQEIIAMFEDVLRRNKAETGKDVMIIWSKHEPLIAAKLNPSLEECGVMTPRMQAMLQMKAQQQLAQRKPTSPLRIQPPKQN
jgi:hypothetical protein